jgi:hypothetical protein
VDQDVGPPVPDLAQERYCIFMEKRLSEIVEEDFFQVRELIDNLQHQFEREDGLAVCSIVIIGEKMGDRTFRTVQIA